MENQINSGTYKSPAESTWTRDEDKLFEMALVHVPENIPGPWHEIAKVVPGKTAEQAMAHYQELLYDVDKIESGQVELPRHAVDGTKSFVGSDSELRRRQISFGEQTTSRHGECGRRKGIPWTKEEHRFIEEIRVWVEGVWERRLAKHLKTVCDHKDANTSGQSCPEISPPTGV
ncbi:hypothetical protein L2E82_32771 [Cichorium intybus]|uniref:Uncharacterized protein n=1 Tax=Cichorium intybus TaxID=13427 RepID=A0ACB9BI26_CICIN|nr:hypothetical protein L2E82_32771 [Cichorium intybus]